jgi:uncharacterized protein YkwD
MNALGARPIPTFFAAAALLLGLPVAAEAATINFSFQNPGGVAQAATRVLNWGAGYEWWADAYGHATVSGLSSGDELHITRDASGPARGCSPPEAHGVIYTVPSPAPANVTITLPASNGPANDPARSSTERGFVGLVNQARTQNGVPPLEIASVLSEAADRYSNYSYSVGVSGPALGHCASGSPQSRIIDVGYPTNRYPSWGEVGPFNAGTAHAAFDGFMASQPHQATLMNPSYRVIGIGRVGGIWTADLVSACNWASGCERAGLTGDYGDPSLADGEPETDGPGSRCVGLSGKQLKKCKAKAIKKCKRKPKKRARKRCLREVKEILDQSGGTA